MKTRRFPKSRFNDFPHFRQLWFQVVMALMAVALIPLLILSRGMSAYGESMLRKSIRQSLETQVVSHRESIDHFLAERIQDLNLILDNGLGRDLAATGVIDKVFLSLQRQKPCFQDLGLLDGQGRHLAYVGPFHLENRNYRQADWFRGVQEKGVYVSDVFMGFRLEPHFVIAVRKGLGGGARILRATVDARYFNTLVAGMASFKEADAFLVDRRGLFQTRSRSERRLMSPSGVTPEGHFEGVRSETVAGFIRLTTWQTQVPWLCVVQIRRSEAFAPLGKARTVMIYALGLSAVLIGLTVVLTTNRLVSMLERDRLNIGQLDRQLRRTSYLAASMELTQGIFSEWRDIQANTDATLAWMREQARGDPGCLPLAAGLDEIRSQNDRGRKTLETLTDFIRPSESVVSPVELNGLVDELVAVHEGELRRRRIEVQRETFRGRIVVRSDRAKLKQVFLNLMQNAVAAVDKDGQITIAVTESDPGVRVIFTDTGPGVAPKDARRIFKPLFTTKPDGTGLGLSICRDIMNALGGTVDVESRPGQGGVFTAVIPPVMPPVSKKAHDQT